MGKQYSELSESEREIIFRKGEKVMADKKAKTATERIARLRARRNELEKERAVIDAKIALIDAQMVKVSSGE